MAEEKVEFGMKDAPTYRSKFTVRARPIVIEGAGPEDEIDVPINGRMHVGHVGDYLVQLEDDRLELWTKERFEREFEVEGAAPAAAPRRLQLEVAP